LRYGKLGNLTHIAQDLYAVDRTALDDVSKSVMQAVADRRTNNEDAQKEEKRKRESDANTLMIEFHQKGTSTKRKEDIALQVAKMGVFSIEQLDKYLSPEPKDGDPYAYPNIETRIVFGDFNQEKADAMRYLRRVSGVPDVASLFSSASDEHKIVKNNKINDIFEFQVNTFRQTNPGVPIPYKQIARQAEETYNTGDRADSVKSKARTDINNTINDLTSSKKLPAGTVIDENTNIDDLAKRYKLNENDTTYLRQRQKTLRGN